MQRLNNQKPVHLPSLYGENLLKHDLKDGKILIHHCTDRIWKYDQKQKEKLIWESRMQRLYSRQQFFHTFFVTLKLPSCLFGAHALAHVFSQLFLFVFWLVYPVPQHTHMSRCYAHISTFTHEHASALSYTPKSSIVIFFASVFLVIVKELEKQSLQIK